MTAGKPHGAPITGLSHVQLLVSDPGASARWYADALGLEPYAEDPDLGYVALRHRGARLVIVLTMATDVHDRFGAEPVPADAPPATAVGLDHVAFAVPDGASLRSWADHLTAVGVRHAGVTLENGNPSLQLRDPDGIAIELVAPGTRAVPDGVAPPEDGS